MRRKVKPPRRTIIFLSCLLALPTVACLMYGMPEKADFAVFRPMLMAGALLGLAHLLIRPLLRLITAPLGCLTFGLSGTAIDIALIYACDHFVDGFSVPGFLYALLTAMFINAVTAFTGARK